jgi:crotonobetainyl-CoA:carnitine CoA-transferase CaiB-like acyl-CoA transferase
LSYEDLRPTNPRLVYCSISGFGDRAAYSTRRALDLVAQAEGGLMSITGEADGAPLPSGAPVADFTTGLLGCLSILLGLAKRDRTGEGCEVDASLMDSVTFSMVPRLIQTIVSGTGVERLGAGHPQSAPYRSFQASDGWFVLCVTTEVYWERFCKAIEMPELLADPRFQSSVSRFENEAALLTIINPCFLDRPRDWWISRFSEFGVICGAIRDIPEIIAAEQAEPDGMIRDMAHPHGGEFTNISGPVRVNGQRTARWSPPPLLSADADSILTEAGYGPDEIATLREQQVVI